MEATESYVNKNGSFNYTGQQIDGIKDKITITKSGLMAAAPRAGHVNVKRYINFIQKNNWKSNFSELPQKRRVMFEFIETRLREFENIKYDK